MKIAALVIVVVCFAWLVYWVALPSNRARFERYGRLIFDDDAEQEHE